MSPQYIERQNRPGQGTLGPDGPPARAFTTGLKPGALTRTPVATMVAVMHCGRLVYQGSTRDLIRFDPAGQDLEGAFLALTGTETVSCPL